MDEGTSTGGKAVEEKAPATGATQESAQQKDRSPEEIRQDIEETREELGDTVAALAERADVKAQAKGKVDEVKQRASDKKHEFVGKAKEASGKAKEASPDSAGQFANQAKATAKENPIPAAAVGAFVGGFLIGRLSKRS